MKCLLLLFFSIQATLQSCPESYTSVQIQNYDGPIYLHSPTGQYYKQPQTYEKYELECTCVKHPNFSPMIIPYNPGYYRDLSVVPEKSFCSVDNSRVVPQNIVHNRLYDREMSTLSCGSPQMGKYGNQNSQYDLKYAS